MQLVVHVTIYWFATRAKIETVGSIAPKLRRFVGAMVAIA